MEKAGVTKTRTGSGVRCAQGKDTPGPDVALAETLAWHAWPPGVLVPTARANQAFLARAIRRHLVGALAPGSYVVISHAAADIGNGDMASMTSRLNELMAQQTTPRSRAQLSQFFEGLDVVEPDLVRVPSGPRP